MEYGVPHIWKTSSQEILPPIFLMGYKFFIFTIIITNTSFLELNSSKNHIYSLKKYYFNWAKTMVHSSKLLLFCNFRCNLKVRIPLCSNCFLNCYSNKRNYYMEYQHFKKRFWRHKWNSMNLRSSSLNNFPTAPNIPAATVNFFH